MVTKTAAVGIEIHDDEPTIEVVKDIRTLAAEEAFANEYVTVEVHPTTDENQSPLVMLNVNGVNQPVMRGIPTRVRRKYVEVLARMKETKYSQPNRDLSNPEVGNQMNARSGLVYPFDLIEDENPRGREWLRSVLAEPA